MCLFIPTVKGLIVFEFDHTDAHFTGFHSINNKELPAQEKAHKQAIITGKTYHLEISVSTTEISATIDGNQISTISLDGTILSTPPHWGEDESLPFRLGLGANSPSTFKNSQVKRNK